jgi:hypothetical protein
MPADPDAVAVDNQGPNILFRILTLVVSDLVVMTVFPLADSIISAFILFSHPICSASLSRGLW